MVYRPDGLQQERTALAWRRSALGFVLVSVLTARSAMVTGHPVIAALSLAVIPVALLSFRGRGWRTTSSSAGLAVLRDGRLPAMVATIAITLCLLVAVLAFVA